MSCIWSFLEVINRMFLNVTVNVIVNAIDILGVLNGFHKLLEAFENRAISASFVADISFPDASSPVSRTTLKPLILSGVSGILGGQKRLLNVILNVIGRL